jgi:hypothetical protein
MNKYSCENLTSAIRKLKTLLPRVDSAINLFKPEDGVLARDEAMKILEQNLFRSLFEKETYDYLIRVLGSKEKLRERITFFETTGKSGKKLKAELDAKEIALCGASPILLESADFETVRAGKRIPTIRLSISELMSSRKTTTYAKVAARAIAQGFAFVPQETGPALLLGQDGKPKTNEWFTAMSKPITGVNSPAVFIFGYNEEEGGFYLNDYGISDWLDWDADDELIFALR